MFQHLLDNHPQIACGGEAFGKDKALIDDPDARFTALSRKVVKGRLVKWCGFRLFRNHISLHHLEDWVGKFPVIFLRRNLFNRYLSECLVAGNLDRKHQVYQKPVQINPKCILKRLEKEEQLTEEIRSCLGDYVEIEYEHILESYGRCLKFLGVDYFKPMFSTERQRVVPHWRLISNYREIVAALRGTKWEESLRRELI